ncbi:MULTISPECIES: hypothetical protein [unclassified Haloferax]|uniref:hypothetical protein n=1 Tax=unclassified Haloferax TaxID=2625095 RepID=UPI000E22F7CD|nr:MULTISPECIES: hypothetical protein [unclassified Haloferax]RDZ32069.1 hypothetical protein C5B88_18635 [Haloferax sp. Atlit-24N]RLM33263.1 hypothetical protein DVK03_19230 [Haloferax sp. Atlit-109R]RLM40699.1 hypothetical protein DVK04_19095 [Haloferax sp. Atlit-105R]
MTDHQYEEGDRVRIDIPDETDPDYDRLHGRYGEIIAILEDDAGFVTGDTRDAVLYRVQLEDGTKTDVRWRDLRPF